MPGEDSVLFTPLTIGKLVIAGRVIKTATSETRASPEGFATRELVQFYEPIARGGTPLIITGNLYVSDDGKATPLQMGAQDDGKIAALAKIPDAVHAHGGKVFAQLSHCGRQVVPGYAGLSEAVSASAVKDLLTGTRPRPLSVEEIGRIVEQFGAAAWRCKQAGFDGVQIHAGHGYLISQFLTPHTNRRTDAYGGPLPNRARLLCEVYRSIRSQVGPDYPVIVKLNGSDALPLRRGSTAGELVEVAGIMQREGIDAVEVSVGHYESGFPVVRGRFWRCLRHMVAGSVRHLPWPRRALFRLFWPLIALASDVLWKPREGFNLRHALRFKRALSIPVLCVGGFYSRATMQAAIERGMCDAVCVGRPFIADPYLYRHLRDGTAGPRCVHCNACVGNIGTQPLDCYHPAVRAQKDAMLSADA